MSVSIKELFDYDSVKKMFQIWKSSLKINFHNQSKSKNVLQAQCKSCRSQQQQKSLMKKKEKLNLRVENNTSNTTKKIY